jgi:hypothetical protein
MFVVSDWLSFNVGFFIGVFGSFLIYAAYHIADAYVAQRKLDSFFDRMGVLKGIAFYEKLAENCNDDQVKKMLTDKTQEYATLARKHEEDLDEIINKYVEDMKED